MKFDENVKNSFITITLFSLFLIIAMIGQSIYTDYFLDKASDEFSFIPENIAERMAFTEALLPFMLLGSLVIIIYFKLKMNRLMKLSNSKNKKNHK